MQLLRAYDQDQDGAITADQFETALSQRFAHRPRVGEQRDRKRGERGPRPRPFGRHPKGKPTRKLFIVLDSDHDGVVSAAQIAAAPRSLLTLYANHGGTLSLDELKGDSHP